MACLGDGPIYADVGCISGGLVAFPSPGPAPWPPPGGAQGAGAGARLGAWALE